MVGESSDKNLLLLLRKVYIEVGTLSCTNFLGLARDFSMAAF